MDPSSWRGIAKKSCCYKLFSLLLSKRLTHFLEELNVIPEEQHGFRPGRSTSTACSLLLEEVMRVLRRPGQFLFAVFIDFKAAFDTTPRNKILQKLAYAGVPLNILEVLRSILQAGIIIIDDGVSELEPFLQTTGVAQGDNLSPLLFSVAVSDLPSMIKVRHPHVDLLLYADDLVMFSRSRFHLQQALVTFGDYIKDLGLEVNLAKTEAMKFRRGGRLANSDELRLAGTPLKYVNSFTYLGLTVHTSGKSFTEHVTLRVGKALAASVGIEKPWLLSMKTALALFDLKVAPVASFGIQHVWEHLSVSQLGRLDRVKPAYLKRVMGLHQNSKNRLVYLLAGTPLFIEDVKKRFSLPFTPAYEQFIHEYEMKMCDINPDFFKTGAMQDDTWKGTHRTNRHIVTRYAIHGFHHNLCRTAGFHEPNTQCRCSNCGLHCGRYHANECVGVHSLSQLNRD